MGNEQQGGTNDNTSNDQSKQQSPTWTNDKPLSITKPSWQIARDISMDILSRKATRLSLKPGIYRLFFFYSLTSNELLFVFK
jgi:hypothetical protein